MADRIYEVPFTWSVSGEGSVLIGGASSPKEALDIFNRQAGPKIHLDRLESQSLIIYEPLKANVFYPSMLVAEAGDDDEIIWDTNEEKISVNTGYGNEIESNDG